MTHQLARAAISSLLLALPLFQGCASTGGSDKVDQTSTRLDTLAASVESLQGNLTGVAAALARVVETAETDPKPAFKEFSSQTDKVAAATEKARANLDRAQSEGKKLFDAWTKRLDTITDADIRKASQERRDELQKALASVADEMTPCVADLEAFVASTKDLHTYLAQDLTPSGIDGISSKSKDLSKSAKSIVSDLDDVVEAARKAAPKFATAKPPKPAE